MVAGVGGFADGFDDLRAVDGVLPDTDLALMVAGDFRPGHDLTHGGNTANQRVDVRGVGQEVGVDPWVVEGVGATQPHGPEALGPFEVDVDLQPRPRHLAPPDQQPSPQPLQQGRVVPVTAAEVLIDDHRRHEHLQLRQGHVLEGVEQHGGKQRPAPRPGAVEQPAPHQQCCPVQPLIPGGAEVDPVGGILHRNIDVVGEIGTHAGGVEHRLDPVRAQVLGGADA